MESGEPEDVVCACLQVTERQLRAAVERSGVRTFRDLVGETGAGAGCTACHRRIEECLAAWTSPLPPPRPSNPPHETWRPA